MIALEILDLPTIRLRRPTISDAEAILELGVAELLGVVGAIFAMWPGIHPWLTPLAAMGLIVIQGFTIFTEHLPKKEYKFLPLNLCFAAMSILVVIGRWPQWGGISTGPKSPSSYTYSIGTNKREAE